MCVEAGPGEADDGGLACDGVYQLWVWLVSRNGGNDDTVAVIHNC